MCWTRQITSCHQPCPGGFAAKITSSPNAICMVNHATKNLQHRILDLSKYCSLHCHMKMERVREKRRLRKQREQREDSDGRGNSTQSEKREKQKSNNNTGWQDRVLHI